MTGEARGTPVSPFLPVDFSGGKSLVVPRPIALLPHNKEIKRVQPQNEVKNRTRFSQSRAALTCHELPTKDISREQMPVTADSLNQLACGHLAPACSFFLVQKKSFQRDRVISNAFGLLFSLLSSGEVAGSFLSLPRLGTKKMLSAKERAKATQCQRCRNQAPQPQRLRPCSWEPLVDSPELRLEPPS